MSAAIAVAPSPPHERSAQNEMTTQNQPAPPPPPAPTSASPTAQKTNPPPPTRPAATGSISPKTTVPKPLSPAKNGAPASSVVVKTEHGSPRMANARPRPHRLDLSNKDHVAAGPATAIGVPGREGLGIQEVGLACLSPGFVTQDPVMKEQLQRSMTVREQQREIIVQRLHQQQANKNLGPHPHQYYPGHHSQYPPDKTPLMSRRPKGPPGLSIVAPSHEQFAHERVIQSAPLGHSFTGRQQYDHHGRPLAPPHHPHHPPPHPHQGHPQGPPQHSARLPPIGDVFSSNNPNGTPQRPEQPPMYADGRPMPSPSLRGPEHPHGHPGHHGPPAPPGPPAPNGQPAPHSARYRSAEEAQQEMARGRPELLPKIVHYGGHQPPTPPSPVGGRTSNVSVSAGKRRTRAEYEGSSPPLGHGPSSARRGPFGAGRDSPETQRQKKEEFLRLCDRAWDLFHS